MPEAGDTFLVSLGTHTFDPAETQPLRRRRGEERPDDAPDPNDTRIVQFVGDLAPADMDRLREEYGLALTAYLPNYAYVERVDAATRRRLSGDPLVRAVAAYRPEYKLDRLVTAQRDAGRIGEVPLVATLFDGGSIELVERELTAAGATDIESNDQRPLGGFPLVAFTAPGVDVLDLACRLPDIRWIELAPHMKEDDVEASAVIQSGSDDNTTVWDHGIHGESQIIGMLEGNTPDIRHCFFDDAAPNTPGAAHRKIVDLRNADADDHATLVAGCLVGDERGNSGNNPNRGSAWAARLAAGRVRRPYTMLLNELNNNRDAGAVIHNNSWHDDRHGPGNPAPYNTVAVQVDIFCWENEHHVVLGSSGNDGEEQGPPGTAKNALCVSAADADGTDIDDGNPGPTLDGRRKPDIVAVGCSIESSIGDECDTSSRSCATSYATPHAAGAAALVRQYFMEGFWVDGMFNAAYGFTPTAALIRAVLVNSAVKMAGESPYPSNTQGWGILRLDRALTFPTNGRNMVVRDIWNEFGLRTGEEFTQEYTVAAGPNQLKVVLAYTDPPAANGATTNTLINNLNLEVTDPNGVKYVGNDFDSTVGLSAPNSTSDGDTLHNLEVVLVNAPVTGVWKIKVRATSVKRDRQGFAIAATATNAPIESSSCFVASAVYGDPCHPDVMALRRWRNRVLQAGGSRAAAMRVVIIAYGHIGPPAATLVARRPRLRRCLRARLFPVLARRLDRPGPGSSDPIGTP